MHIPEVPRCKVSVTPIVLRQKNRVEEEEEELPYTAGHGVQKTTITGSHKRPERGVATGGPQEPVNYTTC